MQSCDDINNNNNFNEELMQLLCQDDDDDDDENICLITNTKLKNNFVKLVCGHKFNYKSIFNEVKNQKKYWNHYETQKLKENEIKCPYCRTIQTGLLPRFVNALPYGNLLPRIFCTAPTSLPSELETCTFNASLY